MHENFTRYAGRLINNTHSAIVNVAMFIPYFFSVLHLTRTLLSPWRNIEFNDDKPGFSLSEAFTKLGNGFASRFIGFMVRSSILTAFVITEVIFILGLPFVYILILVTLPLRYLFYTVSPSEAQKKNLAYQDFLKRHLSDTQNQDKVTEWFNIYYQNSQLKPWWSMERLKSQPPLGRNLSTGFTNNLDKYATELTLQQPHYKHLVGRTKEIEVIQRVLSKTGKANVLLNGEPGVGKTAIIEALAKSMYEGSSSPQLAFKRILLLDMEKVLATDSDFVQREETVTALFEEAEAAKNIVLCIINLEQYVSDGENYVNLTNVFEKYAGSEHLQFIATTTPYMYQKFIFKNARIAELFDKVDIPEITPQQTLKILLDLAPDIEKQHGVYVMYDALVECVSLADRYLKQRPFPEKAIELLDEACVYIKSQGQGLAVDKHAMNTVLQQKTNVPTELDESLKTKLLNLEKLLKSRVMFQDEALQTVASSLRKSFTSLGHGSKPLASFLFLGPTGVGKTLTAKAITEVFFGSEEKMLRFDMSNYQSKENIPQLIGSAETQEPGLLTEAIRNAQYGTLLLDELEKANKDLLNIFLSILDEGYFTDGFGKKVDCTNLIIIATSNAGADFIYAHVSNTQGESTQNFSNALIDHLVAERIFAPEFLNRFGGLVVYKPLYKEAIMHIAAQTLQSIKEQAFAEHKLTVEFNNQFIQNLVEQGYDPRFGARNLKRLIQEHVEDAIAKAILEGDPSKKIIRF